MGIFNLFKKPDLPKPNSESTITNQNLKYLESVLRQWLHGKVREEQLLAEKYYDGEHDILGREKKMIGADGRLVTIENVPNNKLVDNQYRKLVDQKTNYTLGKPLSISTADDEYLNLLNTIFNKNFHRKLRVLTKHAVNCGIAWAYPYYNEVGEFKIDIFAGHEICPVWKDKAHTELVCAMRYYSEDIFDNKGSIVTVYNVDLFTEDGIYHYMYQGGSLIPKTNAYTSYLVVNDQPYSWNRFPLIPYKYNDEEIPLIRNVKSLQDSLNQVLSDFQNNMEEDPRTTILVLKNYDGTNLGEFRQNLATWGVVKVTTVDGVQGGVETLKVEVNAQNYQAILMQLKRAIVENGRGFDAKEERMDGDPNQMNIESMYTDIDLDVNGMETEFQAGFEELKWFIDQYLIHTGHPDYTEESVEFVFNRDIFINEDAKIDNCVKSVGIISNKTIISRHPWVTNVDRELSQIEEDKQADLEEMQSTQEVMHQFSSSNGDGGGSNNED